MESCKESNDNDKAKGNCAPHVNASAASDAKAGQEPNGNDKAKENCSPRVNASAPSTSYAKESTSRRRERKKAKAAVDAEQRRRDNQETKIFYCNFFRENKEILFILDHHTITVIAAVGREFSCTACNIQISNFKKVLEHIKSDKHSMLLELYWLSKNDDFFLPPQLVLNQLDEFLTEVAKSHLLTPKSLSLRDRIAKEINAIFHNVPDCKVVMCGSSFHTAALKDSDLNLRFVVDEKDKNPIVFNSLILRISNAFGGKIRIKKHMYLRNYYCLFSYKNTLCEIKFFEKKHYFNSILVESCVKFDPRVKLLLVLFRHWAKLCRIINKSGESWHSLALDLMVIYFLQRSENPILPIFSEISHCEREVDLKADLFVTLSEWETENTDSLSVLWCDLLKFYSKDFDKFKNIISVTTNAEVTQKSRQWLGKKFAVEDPFAPQSNLLSAPTLEMYVFYCLKKTNLYFRTPQTANGSVFDFIRQDIRPNPLGIDGYDVFVTEQMSLTRMLVRALLCSLSAFEPLVEDEDFSCLKQLQTNWNENYVNICNLNVEPYDPDFSYVSLRKPGHKVPLFFEDANHLMNKFKPDYCVFDFKQESFNGGMKVPVNCYFCGNEIHSSECPSSEQCTLAPNTVISGTSVVNLNSVCSLTLRKYMIDQNDEDFRNNVIREIEHHIQQSFPGATLTPFGSSRNGFGLKNSDLDLCLTFTDDSYGKDFNAEVFLKSLYRVLRRYRSLSNVTCISKATVPIVKFVHVPSRLEGDISIYNTLALINTTLLRLYCKLDWRVQFLGVMIKSFAEKKKILGAPKGYLSSYAYILMVIHFLQGCSPPILPVLQELTADPRLPVPTVMHGPHNVYFMDNAETVKKIWPHFGLNKKSPGELWVEFLYFYTIIFDMDNYVVSIRTVKFLTKQEKKWYVRTLAVEDPFRMDTNLGRGLSMKRHNDIVQCFREELEKHLM